MEFEDWFEELLEAASERDDLVYELALAAPFMYEDYHEQGMTPLEALEAEWG